MAHVSRATEPIARHELVAAALDLGIERPDELSTEELTEAIARASEAGETTAAATGGSGWFAVARHLVASVVEQGLNLPGAARMLRTVGGTLLSGGARARPPLPTVTLAQIYLTQGHDERARATLLQVLERQPDHPKARQLLAELLQKNPSEPEVEAAGAHAPAQANGASSAPASRGGAAHDTVVALLGSGTARIGWELGSVGEQLVADHGVELLVRVVRAGSLGPRIEEFRLPVPSTSGLRAIQLPPDALLCAALCDVHASPGVLGVAAVFDAEGRALASPGVAPNPDASAAALARRLSQVGA